VLAGTNGAGKSSVAGEFLIQSGAEFYDPDQATRDLLEVDPTLDVATANIQAWRNGKEHLERAIAEGTNYVFETTLGGRTITRILSGAAKSGCVVKVWYVGLVGADLHIDRVRVRVARGGHDIPHSRIRERFVSSRANLIELLPHLSELLVFDNSREGDPHEGREPKPVLILHVRDGEIIETCKLPEVPNWAKSIVFSAIQQFESTSD